MTWDGSPTSRTCARRRRSDRHRGVDATQDVAGAALLQEHCGIVAHTARQVGDPRVRHRGTIGGSLAHGDPASDLPTVVLALDGELVARGSGGERTIAAQEFFTGVFQTALAPDEMLVEVRVPKLGPSTGWSYTKMSRRAQDWATVAVAAIVERSNGSIGKASIGLTNMGATPLRATATEEAIASGASLDEAAAHASEGTDPSSDHAASAGFRGHLAARARPASARGGVRSLGTSGVRSLPLHYGATERPDPRVVVTPRREPVPARARTPSPGCRLPSRPLPR